MDTFVAVIVVFGGIIALGVFVSLYLYKSGAIGRRRYRLRRVTAPEPILPVETNEEVVVEDEIVDV